MPNPFKKPEEITPEVLDEEVEGHFGCFESGCGKVVGKAMYVDSTETLSFTCPDGHTNTVRIKL